MNQENTLFYNGKISTMDEKNTVADSIYVEKGIIKYVGKLSDVENGAKTGSNKIDLGGKRVLPGLIDTHTHFTRAALSEIRTQQFVPDTIKDVLDYVKEKTKTTEKGKWIYMPNIYPTRIKDLRFPFAWELDEAAPEHPVYADGFYAGAANTLALKDAGLYNKSDKGVIRDEFGNPTGRVLGMRRIFEKSIPGIIYTPEELDLAIARLGEEYAKAGITSVTEGMSTGDGLAGLARALKNDKAYVRVILTMVMNPENKNLLKDFKRESECYDQSFIKHLYGKVVIDGGILTGTALMRKPYSNVLQIFGYDFDDYYGNIGTDFDTMYRSLDICEELGLKFCVHATGNKSVDLFLDVLEEYRNNTGKLSSGHAVLHGNFMDTATIKRIKELNAALLFQPAWHYKDSHAVENFMDTETFNTFLPYKSLYESGIMCAAGSDHMIKHDKNKSQNPYNPFSAIYNMVTRVNEKGMCIGKEHCVSIENAVRFYTSKAAFQGGGHEDRGCLSIGKSADFFCLTDDIFNCPVERIPYIQSEMTVLNGKIVY